MQRNNNHRRRDNNQNSNMNNSSQASPRSKVSLKRVSELLDQNPDTILLTLADKMFGLEEYLNAEWMSDNLIRIFLVLLNKSFECHSMESRKPRIIDDLVKSNYFNVLVYKSIENKDQTGVYDLELIKNVIKICNTILVINPAKLPDLEIIIDRLELITKLRMKNQELIIEFDEKIEKMKLEIEERKKKSFDRNNNNVNPTNVRPIQISKEFLTPPDKVKNISILPSLTEINTNQNPFLRKNVINGPYKDVEHYIDIHFRLLREDFLQPLRKGITHFKEIIDEQIRKTPNILPSKIIESVDIIKKIAHIEGLRAYFNVSFTSNICSDRGVTLALQLDVNKCKDIKWEFSKRLLFGSLVCLSDDFFKNNFILAVICDRDNESLKKGIIKVRIEQNDDVDDDLIINEKTKYIMFETTAYFEAYRYVLDALKSIDQDEFPFKRQIIECKSDLATPPDYLVNAYIDMRTLVDNKNNFNHSTDQYMFDSSLDYARNCSIDNERRWPSPTQMMLDESQYQAVKLALTKQVALIQGPPGTGKTFIGVKIMKLLLNNSSLWSKSFLNKRKRPILMLCFTNHALDQFLESIIRECSLTSGVVRVGGRCKNPQLEDFLLKNIKSKVRQEKKTNKSLFYQTKDEERKSREIQDEINLNLSKIDMSKSGILKLYLLEEFMRNEYFFQLGGQSLDLLNWLGFNVIEDEIEHDLADNLAKTTLNNKTTVDEIKPQENVEEDEEDIDIDEEERMLDEDIFEHNNKNTNKKRITNIEEFISETDKTKYYFSESDLQERFKKTTSSDDWVEVGKKGKPNNSIKRLLKKITSNEIEKDIIIDDIWSLTYDDRICLYTRWVNLFKQDKNININNLKQNYRNSINVVSELRMQEDRMIMEEATIVALTTTGAARYHKILQDIGPRIVIVEEAAEVFESHVITALSPNCEHLILIGDHVQLKPKPNVYDLARNYNMDISLFERLIKNKLDFVTLTCQHRMRPEISLLMKHFYNNIEIEDHSSVKNRDDIIGLKQNISFITHTMPEDNYDEGKSKTNKFEAQYLVKFAKYLIRQHYSPTQITILTTYLGQMFLIREELRREKVKDVKSITVDNYQGEENDIILLSLVRSNKDEKIGFLAIENRICVALSRARCGLFVIGNFNLLNKTSLVLKTKWEAIINTMKLNKCISNGLYLSCKKHVQNDIFAEKPDDFDKRPEGGCSIRCDYRLDCGHTCPLFCHLYDSNHETIKCKKECGKDLECKHKCTKKCGHKNECKTYDCTFKVVKKLPCGHDQSVPCYQNPDSVSCTSKCSLKLECGHQCSNKCVEKCGPCKELLDKTSTCRHSSKIKVPCKTSQWELHEFCNTKCSAELNCGHLCSSNCGYCLGGRIHASCKEKCNRDLVCGHQCSTPCAKNCPPCNKQCENRCSHSKCPSKCSLPCVPCKEKCAWFCEHKKCNKLCYQFCDREPCDLPCNKKLKCDHSCIGYCGEICPPLCRICQKDKVTEIFFGTEDEEDARFVYLEDCRHIVESSGMKNWMDTNYGDKKADEESTSRSIVIKLPDCPKCKTPIRRNLRYSLYVKRQLLAIEEVKVKSTGTRDEILKLKLEFLDYLDKNQFEIEDHYSNLKQLVLSEKNISKVDLIELENRLKLFLKLVNIGRINRNTIKDEENKSHLKYEINKLEYLLFRIDFKSLESFSDQSQNEILNEIKRVDRLHQYFKCKEYFAQRLISNTNSSFKLPNDILIQLEYLLINKIIPYEKKVEEQVRELFKNLQPHLTGLQISDEEKEMILKAMNLSKGHWYKCKNGHVYCITECGGAMEQSRCPDCGDSIGGQNHALVQNNAVATEMDGAKHAAWSDQANLQNFDLDDLI